MGKLRVARVRRIAFVLLAVAALVGMHQLSNRLHEAIGHNSTAHAHHMTMETAVDAGAETMPAMMNIAGSNSQTPACCQATSFHCQAVVPAGCNLAAPAPIDSPALPVSVQHGLSQATARQGFDPPDQSQLSIWRI